MQKRIHRQIRILHGQTIISLKHPIGKDWVNNAIFALSVPFNNILINQSR